MVNKLENVDESIIEDLMKLPKDFWDFKDSDTKELTHSIHNYPAVMVYPISRNIINTVKKYQTINSLLDPFMGSGTVLLEGMLGGISHIYGNDLNPLAHKIARAKTKILDGDLQKEREKFVAALEKDLEEYKTILEQVTTYVENQGYDITAKVNKKEDWGANAPQILRGFLNKYHVDLKIPEITNLGFWFVPRCVLELQLLRMQIDKIQDEDIREYFMLAFSETTRRVSNRRNGEFKMYRMKPEKVKIYKPDVIKEYLKILDANIEKMLQLKLRMRNEVRTAVNLSFDDARKLQSIPDECIDLVITSPPYGDSRTTVAYGQFSRVSLQWCDYDKLTYKEIIDIDKRLMGGTGFKKGFDNDIDSNTLRNALNRILEDDKNLERAGDVYSFYKDLQENLQVVTQKCKDNAYQFWVVGNRTVKGVQLLTNEILVEMGSHMGLKHVITLRRNISNKVMPSLNSPSNIPGDTINTMNEELIVVLRKEPA